MVIVLDFWVVSSSLIYDSNTLLSHKSRNIDKVVNSDKFSLQQFCSLVLLRVNSGNLEFTAKYGHAGKENIFQ